MRGRHLGVEITATTATYMLRGGEPLRIAHHGQPITVTPGHPPTRPIIASSVTTRGRHNHPAAFQPRATTECNRSRDSQPYSRDMVREVASGESPPSECGKNADFQHCRGGIGARA
jgi:hypothetical protein